MRHHPELVPCSVCGRQHEPGSRRQRDCARVAHFSSVATAGTDPENDFQVAGECFYEEPPSPGDERGTHHMWLQVDGAPVGYLRYVEYDDHCLVRHVEVHPDHRGKGYSGDLIDQAEDHADKTLYTSGRLTPSGYDALIGRLDVHHGDDARVVENDRSLVRDWSAREHR